MDKILQKLLNPLLDRLPGKWKTATGLICLTGLYLAYVLGQISEETLVVWGGAASVLFGVGIYHKVAGQSTPPESKP